MVGSVIVGGRFFEDEIAVFWVIGIVLAVGALIAWRNSGGTTVVTVDLGRSTAECRVPDSRNEEATAFLNEYSKLKEGPPKTFEA